MNIVGQMIVKNEENFVWYAINSVINHLDKLIIWDQGSSDKTIEIIKSIDNPKIVFKKVTKEVHLLRQEMLEESDCDWVFTVDGDEVWFDDAIKNLIEILKKDGLNKECVTVPNYMLIGDIFHYQEKAAGKYKIGDKTGHFNIRAVKKTIGLHIEGVYPNEAYVTKEGIKIQDLEKEKILFLNQPYLHASFLKRSSKDKKKVKYEIGESFPKDFNYPEVLFRPRPSVVPSPWKKMTPNYRLRAFLETPLKRIKRRIV